MSATHRAPGIARKAPGLRIETLTKPAAKTTASEDRHHLGVVQDASVKLAMRESKFAPITVKIPTRRKSATRWAAAEDVWDVNVHAVLFIGTDCQEGCMRQILILPPHNLWRAWTNPPSPAEPDQAETFRLLASRGYRYCLDTSGRIWNPFAESHPILRAVDPARALRVLLCYRSADVVFCFFESSALLILLLRRLFRFRGKVVVFDVGIPGTWRLRNMILRLVLCRADMLLPLGRNQVAGLLAMGARPGTVQHLRTATDTDFFEYVEDQLDGYILAVGDDVSRDYHTFLEASAGFTCETIIRSRLVTEDKVVSPNVTVMSNSLTVRDYQRLIAGAIVVVLPLHPSVHAGVVSTLLEAMSSGKAIIVSASPGLADYLRDGETCRVVPAGNPIALREAVDELLANPVMRRKLGVNARRFVVENCSAETCATQFATVLGQLLDQTPCSDGGNP